LGYKGKTGPGLKGFGWAWATLRSRMAELLPVEALIAAKVKRTREMFQANHGGRISDVESARKMRLAIKVQNEYAVVKDLPPPQTPAAAAAEKKADEDRAKQTSKRGPSSSKPPVPILTAEGDVAAKTHLKSQAILQIHKDEMERQGAPKEKQGAKAGGGMDLQVFKPPGSTPGGSVIVRGKGAQTLRPEWHAPWKLMRVISGHLGWVRCIDVEPGNEWFVTGAADRTLKIWDLASGELKLTLTGHISPVRGVAISDRHPYMFTVGEDKLVKCWDLETNKVIRHYHGHLSGVYCCALHPTLDVLCTGGRDSSVRVWDVRTKNQIFCMAGHKDTVGSLACQATDPQIISGSQDSTVRLWDLAAGKAYATLTHHKKSIRGITIHPTKYLFATASADNIKQWKCPEGTFMRNIENSTRAIADCLVCNSDNVLVCGYDNGAMQFFDWKTGYNFHTEQTRVQPGSLDAEAAIYAMTFDRTGTRLITCEADKTIKVWREDPDATPQTHPIDFRPQAPGTEKRW
jgi:pleiotropic regulator 1